jgi:hypothetical protein
MSRVCHYIGPVADPDFPDIFADGLSVSTGPFGMSLTFYLSDPLKPPAAGSLPGTIAARIRVAPALAEALADNIKQGLAILPDRGAPKADE